MEPALWHHALMAIETVHHGQLAMPPGGDAAARAFYGGVLGIAEIAKPPHPANRGGCLFESGQVRVHLGVEQDHRPARKAHPALQVDDPAALSARLEAAGGAVRCGAPLPGYDRLYVDDPVGNRIELLQISAPL